MILLHSQVGQDLWGSYTIEILLWLLGAFILGYLLRYFIGAKWRNRVAVLEKDLEEWKARSNQFEADLSTAKYEREKSAEELAKEKSKNADLYFKLKACEETLANTDATGNTGTYGAVGDLSGGGVGDGADDSDSTNIENIAAAGLGFAGGNVSSGDAGASGALTGYAAAFTDDNLKVVEGIGPKIESLLKSDGIGTWGSLAGSGVDRLNAILDKAGSRYRMHDPKTWPEQAQMANDGRWEDLIHFQKFLDGGKDDPNRGVTPSKVEKMYMKAHGLKSYAPDDLKVVEGIGPKIEQLLKNAGINNWVELSDASTSKIQETLNNAGERFRLADPSTWSKQATLAAAGRWAELKQYQDDLQGGKE